MSLISSYPRIKELEYIADDFSEWHDRPDEVAIKHAMSMFE